MLEVENSMLRKYLGIIIAVGIILTLFNGVVNANPTEPIPNKTVNYTNSSTPIILHDSKDISQEEIEKILLDFILHWKQCPSN